MSADTVAARDGYGRPTSYGELASVLDVLPLLLRERRRQRGLSQRAAAKEIGCSFSTVSRMEIGKDGRLNTAVQVLHWLDDGGAKHSTTSSPRARQRKGN